MYLTKIKRWEAKLPGGKKFIFDSDTPREALVKMGFTEFALTQIEGKKRKRPSRRSPN